MTTRTYPSSDAALAVLKEAVWLAWKAAGGPRGLGFLQNKPTATKDDVWDQAFNERDYTSRSAGGEDLDADYVFGRMLKLSIRRVGATLTVSDSAPHPAYQGWCGVYTTYTALLDAAEKATSLSPQEKASV